ncbi:MAG: alpha/beta fold hydrolase [Miltoncostaeaceae bacterium]
MCLHGFTDTWRTWELILPPIERYHEVLAPTLAGHAGGPALPDAPTRAALAECIERQMDAAGFATAHMVGNSLGGHLALDLAARGRARSVVALSPAGGWERSDEWFADMIRGFLATHEDKRAAAAHAASLMATREGRRRATRSTAMSWEHIPADLLEHQLVGAAACAVPELVDLALREGYSLDAEQITCPVRIIWGADDQLLPLPRAAVRYRRLLPLAEWIELDGVGHCPQLDIPTEAAQLILDGTR